MTTAMVPSPRAKFRCSRCKLPVQRSGTCGGWDPHICHDKLRSNAFDFYLWVMQGIWDGTVTDDEERMHRLRMKMPLHERLIAVVIVLHVMNTYVEARSRSWTRSIEAPRGDEAMIDQAMIDRLRTRL